MHTQRLALFADAPPGATSVEPSLILLRRGGLHHRQGVPRGGSPGGPVLANRMSFCATLATAAVSSHADAIQAGFSGMAVIE